MKAILIVFLLLRHAVYGQSTTPDFQPYFSAVVVKDLTASVKWYQSVFDLKIKTEMNDPNQSYKIKILESSNYLLEVLELKGSMIRNELLKGKPNGTELQGHFKIGFKISNANAWVVHLKSLGIDVPQLWTDSNTGKKNFLIKDPDGNLIQFFE